MVIFEGLPDKLEISLSSECFVSSASSSQLYTRKVSFRGEKSSVATLAATILVGVRVVVGGGQGIPRNRLLNSG